MDIGNTEFAQLGIDFGGAPFTGSASVGVKLGDLAIGDGGFVLLGDFGTDDFALRDGEDGSAGQVGFEIFGEIEFGAAVSGARFVFDESHGVTSEIVV